MDAGRRALRAALRKMYPNRAIQLILDAGLPEEEARFLIDCDVKKMSAVEAAIKANTTPETVKRRRRQGLDKLLDAQHPCGDKR